ncbi:MAG TPA: SUMF1/EgtB/PvdO family nonheme iron enzyme [Candidatus Sulfopaludibacter sp.]|jgi:formylglycine-generating enzyme required for sulfatase activity|nr:SUMF1/EgtB/PvdO family nonheme iron enzyme [Candidatus Sulfopaludibacter sp.]
MFRIAVLAMCLTAIQAQETKYPPQGQQFPGPPTKADTAEWLREMQQYREERRIRAGLNGDLYARPELQWAQSSFMQPQSMVEDRYLYDPAARRYTVDRFLTDLDKRYGGIDSVLLWPVYPNIGIDNRNQFDLLRDMPGGIAGLREMIADFHRRGVRVLFPTMPWDMGTRREPRSMPETLAGLMKEIGADGVNGDTFGGVPRTYLEAADAVGHPLVFEPEGYPDGDEMLNWNSMSWGYWKYPFVPMVSRGKWLEPRHMVNVCDRWNKDKTDNLQAAFFNGVGYETWENIWGIWNGVTERDAEAIRRVAKVERRFAEYLVSGAWEPHTPTVAFGVFASKFPKDGRTLWTLVNRAVYNIEGPQLPVAAEAGMHYYDLWHGVELQPVNGVLSFGMEALGYGAILAQRENADTALTTFLGEMRALTARPLASFPKQWRVLPQQIVPMEKTARSAQTPAGMVRIPAANFRFEVHGVEIEGSDDIGVDVQYPGEDSPRRHHVMQVPVAAFDIDKFPVTNGQFAEFLRASNYRPADDHNFLRDWKGGTYPEGWEKRPVTWVSLEDARAYAKWAGKRLPHEWEWQYAAQGLDGRAYPWGTNWCDECAPKQDHGYDLRGATPVDAFPKGASPFGVMDMTGNVWQWTEELQDEHTRAAVLRGGSYYRPGASHWYFPAAYKLTEHGKYLLIAPSKDRAGTVGFRCVKDAQ